MNLFIALIRLDILQKHEIKERTCVNLKKIKQPTQSVV